MVYDGPNEKAMLIGELFGTPYHKILKSISSSGKSIFIDFKKMDYGNSALSANGGNVEFVASIKYNKINPDCQSWLDNNVLMSPNHPNINCSWIITRKFGPYIILDFSYVEVN